MLQQIRGLHHVTSLAASARAVDAFFTRTLGLRRVKKTVNFDAPEIYHLYYGTELGAPGTAMTYFPFPHAARGQRGVGETSRTAFAVPPGSLDAWSERLAGHGPVRATRFGAPELTFAGPDGDGFALVEARDDRAPWTGGGVPAEMAIRGFHSVTLRLRDTGATAELMRFMGFDAQAAEGNVSRFALTGGNGARIVDMEAAPDAPPARSGAGSVHHVAFAVETGAHQLETRAALVDAGYRVTPVIDRDYFLSVYFQTPGGVLFEVATDGPGFTRDEDPAHLGAALKLPAQHAHLRAHLERSLDTLDA